MNKLKRLWVGFTVSDSRKSFPNQTEYVIAYHDPMSITWSWCFRWNPPWRLKKWSDHSLRRKITGYYSLHKQAKMMKK